MVTVIIPALNEEQALPLVLEEIPRDIVRHILVVDNGSTDNTAQAAQSAGATVISEPRRGYGQACLTGLAHVPENTEIVVFLDADHSDYPQDLIRLIEPIQKNKADLIIGSRVQEAPKGALFPQQRFGNWLATRLIKLFFGYSFTDLGPFRAIRWQALKDLGMQDRTFGWTVEMQIKAILRGLSIAEVPVRYRPRIGKSKISGTFLGTLKAGHKILWTIAKYGTS